MSPGTHLSAFRTFVARFGLLAKALLYLLTGFLAFSAALGEQATYTTDRSGAFTFILHQPAGKILLVILALGLLSFSLWRFMQAVKDTESKGSRLKGIGSRASYFFSGLAYTAVSFLGFKIAMLAGKPGTSDSNKEMVHKLLVQPFGQVLIFSWALILTSIGVYQIFYGLSEKFRKHIDTQHLSINASKMLVRAGKIGYVARGVVWLILAFLISRAALHQRSSEAGDTSIALSLIKGLPSGELFLAAIAIGFVCYSLLNLFRMAYEKIN